MQSMYQVLLPNIFKYNITYSANPLASAPCSGQTIIIMRDGLRDFVQLNSQEGGVGPPMVVVKWAGLLPHHHIAPPLLA